MQRTLLTPSLHGMNPLCLVSCFVDKFTKFVVEQNCIHIK